MHNMYGACCDKTEHLINKSNKANYCWSRLLLFWNPHKVLFTLKGIPFREIEIKSNGCVDTLWSPSCLFFSHVHELNATMISSLAIESR